MKNQLTEFFRWLTHTHTLRWHAHHQSKGTGHLDQGRFETFPIESDEHLLAVLRYVERNPVRAKLCKRTDGWKYSSAWLMQHGDAKQKKYSPSGRYFDRGLGTLTSMNHNPKANSKVFVAASLVARHSVHSRGCPNRLQDFN
ncbi:MAG: hypothetical protein NTW52_01020 [Planctomycetota bacterium]|nr:hypothetical protein [Planctomycetota bacterium]